MVNARLRLDRRPVVGDVNHLAHLAQLDQQLRRVGRNDQHVGMGLDEDARLALVGFAQVVAGGHGLGHALFKVGGVADAGAVAATAAEVGQAVGFRGIEAVDGLASISASVYLPAPRGPARISECGNRSAAHALAQMRDGRPRCREIRWKPMD